VAVLKKKRLKRKRKVYSPFLLNLYNRVVLYNGNYYSGKTGCGKDLNFCSQVTGSNLHHIIHKSWKNYFMQKSSMETLL
jgi:hypothetical protein